MDWLKKAVIKLWPELAEGHHLPKDAVVVRIPGSVTDGQLSTEAEPRYAVDIRMLDEYGVAQGPVYESVPLPVPFAGHARGQFAFPPIGTRALVQFAYGSPQHPRITDIYPVNLHLPALETKETLIMHTAATYLRSTQDENWDLRARNKIRIGNQDVDLVEAVQRLAAIAESHTHLGVGTPSQAAAFGKVKTDVGKIKVS